MKQIHVAAAIILNTDKEPLEILATERGYGDYKGGWEFPGGKLEKGEDAATALKREIREELDAEIQILKPFCTVEHDYPDFHLSMDCFLATLCSEPTLLEHSDARWLTKETLDSVSWLPADIAVVNKLKEELPDS